MIEESSCPADIKKAAGDAAAHMIEVNIETKYDALSETDLLALVLDQAAGTQEQKDYLTANLADAKSVCGQGRASRLVDCLALVQETPILPEALIKKQLTEELQQLHAREKDPATLKQQF